MTAEGRHSAIRLGTLALGVACFAGEQLPRRTC